MPWLAGMRITAQRLTDNAPRTVDWATLTSNTAVVTTTETLVLAGNSVTFRAGRAYRVTFRGLAQSNGTANNGCRFRLRKTNAAGTVVREWWAIPLFSTTASRNFAVDLSTVLTNGTAADITAPLAVTFVRDWGSDGILVAGTSGTPTSLHIEEIGDASTVSGAQPIT